MSKLVEGNIPAFTPCPFRNECILSRCFHKAEKHEVPFSCGAARAFDITKGD